MTLWMKLSWNAHDQRTLRHSDWQLSCQICLFYIYWTSKLDFYILNAPVSNRRIIEQEVRMSQYFYCSWANNTIHKFSKSFLDSFGSWCINASLTSVIPITLVRSSSDFQIFNDFKNLFRKQVNCIWSFEIVVKPLLRYGFKCSLFNFSTQMI